MKKKDLARLLDQAKRSIETMQHRAHDEKPGGSTNSMLRSTNCDGPVDVRLITPGWPDCRRPGGPAAV
jgi:hypothetical protein